MVLEEVRGEDGGVRGIGERSAERGRDAPERRSMWEKKGDRATKDSAAKKRGC